MKAFLYKPYQTNHKNKSPSIVKGFCVHCSDMKVDIKHLEKSEVEISVEVSNEVLIAKWDAAVKEIQKLCKSC